ncbi:MAG: tRNA 2-selenouridine(34) synthase MnmH [Bacteroidetes bacterium]|nr:tRNA 2-selenouridine(34) synthase MnmH [Bacteroidota bacterium]MDA1119821.1 tRNA 2-selenouridine(34) synthase MnmH [Bacteroidota bacterium]
MAVIQINEFLELAEENPVVDVRSPKEFNHGHIPGAVNIPLFNDEERAQVGTTYKQVSREEAITLGLEIVGPKMKDFVLKAKSLNLKDKLLVHCWRGGMRSESMAWLFNTSDIESVTLHKGYKAFRNHALKYFSTSFRFVILTGSTGSGKTEILNALKAEGEQVIDLEALANHKGSVFGGLGKSNQPTTEQFQNDLFWELAHQDVSKRIWLEDESIAIGKIFIPNDIWDQMRKSRLIRVEISKQERVKRLVNEYGNFEAADLEARIRKIEKKLGGQHMKEAIENLIAGNIAGTADTLLTYYDKAYSNALERKNKQLLESTYSDNFDATKIANNVLSIAQNKI